MGWRGPSRLPKAPPSPCWDVTNRLSTPDRVDRQGARAPGSRRSRRRRSSRFGDDARHRGVASALPSVRSLFGAKRAVSTSYVTGDDLTAHGGGPRRRGTQVEGPHDQAGPRRSPAPRRPHDRRRGEPRERHNKVDRVARAVDGIKRLQPFLYSSDRDCRGASCAVEAAERPDQSPQVSEVARYPSELALPADGTGLLGGGWGVSLPVVCEVAVNAPARPAGRCDEPRGRSTAAVEEPSRVGRRLSADTCRRGKPQLVRESAQVVMDDEIVHHARDRVMVRAVQRSAGITSERGRLLDVCSGRCPTGGRLTGTDPDDPRPPDIVG